MVFLDCGRMEGRDLRSIQVLARQTLRAKRKGLQCRLLYASGELRQLISFVGLDRVLVVAAGFPPRSSGDDLRRPGAEAA